MMVMHPFTVCIPIILIYSLFHSYSNCNIYFIAWLLALPNMKYFEV